MTSLILIALLVYPLRLTVSVGRAWVHRVQPGTEILFGRAA